MTPDDSDADHDVFAYVPATRALTRLSIGGDGPTYLEERGVSADGHGVLFTSSSPLVGTPAAPKTPRVATVTVACAALRVTRLPP